MTKIILISSDKQVFEVNMDVAIQSRMVKNIIEDTGVDEIVPIPNVHSRIFALVIEFCKFHADAEKKIDDRPAKTVEEVDAWDAMFMNVDQSTLLQLIHAANYLDIEHLLNLTCQTIAQILKGKTPEEIRMILNIENDLTPEEKDDVRRETQWAWV